MKTIKISTPFIKLDSLLKFTALCASGGEAKLAIADELVSVNGEICTARGKKIVPGDKIAFNGEEFLVSDES